MAKTSDEIVRMTLGSFVIEVAMQREQIDALKARVAELTPKPETLKVDAPGSLVGPGTTSPDCVLHVAPEGGT